MALIPSWPWPPLAPSLPCPPLIPGSLLASPPPHDPGLLTALPPPLMTRSLYHLPTFQSGIYVGLFSIWPSLCLDPLLTLAPTWPCPPLAMVPSWPWPPLGTDPRFGPGPLGLGSLAPGPLAGPILAFPPHGPGPLGPSSLSHGPLGPGPCRHFMALPPSRHCPSLAQPRGGAVP